MTTVRVTGYSHPHGSIHTSMDLHGERKKKMKASPAGSGSRRFKKMEEAEAPCERKMEGGEEHR
jgi:hypothetical protein